MNSLLHSLRRFLAELRRRKVYRVAVTYVVAAFAGLEGLDLLVPITRIPAWAPRLFLVLAVLGFPLTVVLAWAFKVTPEGIRRTDRAEAEAEPDGPGAVEEAAPSLPLSGWLTGILLLLLAGAGVWYGVRPEQGPAVDPSGRRVVAVLPFTTSGAAVEDLGEGMVNLLSTALDGAGRVRAVDQRTVLARWDREAEIGGEPDLRTALALARRLGAEWAVLGSVTSVGNDARFVAQVVRPETGKRVGEVQLQAIQDSLLPAIDALTREILGLLFGPGGEEITPVPMASLTTRSVPALKAFLTGERHYRQGRLDSALAGYGRAVDEDSTFALAHLRRSIARGWATVTPLDEASLEEAYRYRETLPQRARLTLVGAYLFRRGDARGADTLEYGTEQYPDDPELWSWLGETYFHKLVCTGPEAADSAFSRATELTPGFAPYWIHPIQLAIGFHRDSALAAARIEALGRVEGATGVEGYVRARTESGEAADPNEDPWIRLVFGHGPAGARVEEFLDAVERGDVEVEPGVISVHTGHPSLWALQDTLLRRAVTRNAPSPSRVSAVQLVPNSLRAGRLRRALDDLARLEVDDRVALWWLVMHRSVGVPVPDSVLRTRLEALQDTEVRDFVDVLPRTIAAVELDAPGLAPSREELFAWMEERSGADSARTVRTRRTLEGYRAWKAGDREKALDLFEGNSAWNAALWRAELYHAAGRLEEAARCYRSQWEQPVAYRGLGDVYAEMGKSEEAVKAYRTFLGVWQGSEDPAVQAEVQEVLERVIELSESLESAESAAGTDRPRG